MTNRVHRQSFPASGVSPAGDHTQRPAGVRSLDNTLAVLEHLDQSNLQMRWRELFGRKRAATLDVEISIEVALNAVGEFPSGGTTLGIRGQRLNADRIELGGNRPIRTTLGGASAMLRQRGVQSRSRPSLTLCSFSVSTHQTFVSS